MSWSSGKIEKISLIGSTAFKVLLRSSAGSRENTQRPIVMLTVLLQTCKVPGKPLIFNTLLLSTCRHDIYHIFK